jgi:tRNA(Ile2) C34 agmatinyltransferase TiaS
MATDKYNERCYECGGEIESENVGDYIDWVCQDCGIVIDSKKVVENQERCDELDDFEVME